MTGILADFTVSDVTAIVTAVVGGVLAIIGAIVAAIVQIRGGQNRAETQREKNQASNDKKLDEIHVLTNSNLTKVNAELTASKKELADLRDLVEGIAKKGPFTPGETAKASVLTDTPSPNP